MDARVPQSEASAGRPANLLARFLTLFGGKAGTTAKQKLRGPLMIGGTVLVVLIAFTVWITGGRYVSTDDAYVHAAKLMVSAEVSGRVAEVDVKEGDTVAKGQVLFKLDAQPFEIALANAKARAAEAVLGVQSMKADYLRMESAIAAQKAQVALAQSSFSRIAKLFETHYASRASYDQARFQLEAAKKTLQALEDEAKTQIARLGGSDIDPANHPQVLEAQAAVDEAERQLNAATVRAPFAGTVTQVSSLQPGQYIVSTMASFVATSAVGLVATDKLWIDANLKETQLTHVKPGDEARIRIDTYPGHTWRGTVASICPATGAEFSLLPAVNSSGNWVKVVQRLCVRVNIDHQADEPALRAGLSANVRIDTKHRRSLGDLI